MIPPREGATVAAGKRRVGASLVHRIYRMTRTSQMRWAPPARHEERILSQ
ncbi:hypothetical protein GCM10022198_10770 [Klugiella xanthotipulae]